MFGLIAPQKSELKVRELAQYNAYYCGLCKAIAREYGQLPRVALNYDCTFMAMVLSGINGETGFSRARCAFKPIKKPWPVAQHSPSLSFSAALSVLLFWYKLMDDRMDEQKRIAAAGGALLNRAKRCAGRKNPELSLALERGMAELCRLEREACAELDAAADVFASMMKDCIALAPLKDEKARAPLCALAYNIAKWSYYADAWEDRAKDEKSGAYNPFLAAGAGEERAAFLLNYSLNSAIAAYELLDAGDNSSVLENILYIGCVNKTAALLGGAHD